MKFANVIEIHKELIPVNYIAKYELKAHHKLEVW